MIIIPYDKDNRNVEIYIPRGYTSGATDCPDCRPDCEGVYHSGYTRGYSEGYEDGFDDGQQDCPECSGSTDCSSAVTRAYNSGYTNGYAAGQADCPVCPPCPPCPSGDCSEEKAEAYSSGITAGVAQQKALLTSTAITTSGTYTRENGWNSVTVNISQKKQAIIGTIEATGVEMVYGYLDIQNCAGGMHTDWVYELDGFANVGDSGLTMEVSVGTHTLNIYTDNPEDRIAIKNSVGVWTSVQFWQL